MRRAISSSARFCLAVISAAALSLPSSAAADDPALSPPTTIASDDLATPLHIRSSFAVATDGGSSVRLPPAFVVSEPAWSAFDEELRRLQAVEVRLNAENTSLKASAKAAPPVGWGTLILASAALAIGVGVGAYAF